MAVDPRCFCARCDTKASLGKPWPEDVVPGRMNICDTCGSKRCARAEWHRNKCENQEDR